jgi:hypothetical protein
MEGFVGLIGLAFSGLIAFLIAQDANSRGMNGVVWGIFVFLFCIITLPLYLIVRKPHKTEQ